MIFCTIGTTNLRFPRLIQALDSSLIGQTELLILQGEVGEYILRYPHVKLFHELPFHKMIYHMSRARAVISHAGAGTFLLALRYSNVKPFVLPRLLRYGEHIDNHQLFFLEYIHSHNLVVTNTDNTKLVRSLHTYLRHPPKQQNYQPKDRVWPLLHHLDSLTHASKCA